MSSKRTLEHPLTKREAAAAVIGGVFFAIVLIGGPIAIIGNWS